MALAHPWTLLLALLGIVVVWLYGRPLPARRLETGLGSLWQQALKAEPLRAAWQPWRGPVSLAVQLVILALVVLAVADPQVPRPRRLVVIVDNSPSMLARDVNGRARLDEARRLARLLARGVRSVDRLAVVAAGDGIKVCCTSTNEPAVLEEAIGSIQPGSGPANLRTALALAREMLAGAPNGRIVVISDGRCDGAQQVAADEQVQMVVLGGPADNLAITGVFVEPAVPAKQPADQPEAAGAKAGEGTSFARPVGVERARSAVATELLVELSNFAGKSASCRLHVQLDGKPVESVPATPLEVRLEAGGQHHQLLRLPAQATGRVTVRIERLDGQPEDILPEDDSAVADLPAAAGPGDADPMRCYSAARKLLGLEAARREADLRRGGLAEQNGSGSGAGRVAIQSAAAPEQLEQSEEVEHPDQYERPEQVVASLTGGVSLRAALLIAALLLAAVQWCLEQRRWLT